MRRACGCARGDLGYNIQTLNCVGYDHNWARGYHYQDDAMPLLPKGTILHIIGYMTTRRRTRTPGSAQLAGFRQPFGREHVHRPWQSQVAHRTANSDRDGQAAREAAFTKNDVVVGCPVRDCPPPAAKTSTAQQQQQQ
jgi:hypothetical protein